ncbi:MAG: GldL-related protein, partial [Bacteroidia bacterium]
VIIGSMLKVMHWPFGNLIITAGLTAIVFVYTIRFIKKVTKKQLDILKLLWLMVFCFAAVFKINHWPWGNILLTMQTGFFLLLLFSFLYGLMQKNKSVA